MITTVAMLLLLEIAGAATSSVDADAKRFTVAADLTPAPARSGDGRFEVQATARLAAPDDQRFVMKSTAASCSAGDGIFSDGFE